MRQFSVRFGAVVFGLGLLAATGCDADQDGLSNNAEKDLGTDPKSADSDADGISDGDEQAAGLNPLSADSDGDRLADFLELELGSDALNYDSDGDSYYDGDEVTEGKDPLDASSVIYEGGWPYYWNKDAIHLDRIGAERARAHRGVHLQPSRVDPARGGGFAEATADGSD